MIIDPIQVFKCLNDELEVYGHFYKLIISGGAVIALSLNERRTNDIDVVQGDFDEEMIAAANIVAKKMKLKEGWLNKSASSFNGDFEPGWENRTSEVFSGKNLLVESIHMNDMIRTKYFAFLNRGFDMDDLKYIKPPREIIIKLMHEVIFEKKASRPDHDIKMDTDDLLRELGYEQLTVKEK